MDIFFSSIAGKLSRKQFPPAMLKFFLKSYCSFYKVNEMEMEQDLASFTTFEEFFTRRIQPKLRPIDPEKNAIVSPADSKVSEWGKIEKDKLLQTKGKYFTLDKLIGEEYQQTFLNGSFITLYLGPGDYHRYHTPFAGDLVEGKYLPGKKLPVNQFGVKKFDDLFCRNERFFLLFETPKGIFGMLFVAALIVGNIQFNFLPQPFHSGKTLWNPKKCFEKGEELGYFSLGSTILLLFPEKKVDWHIKAQHERVYWGQKIGQWK